MQPSWSLRTWQREALARFEASATPDFLAVATPGAGKTSLALAAARQTLLRRDVRRVVVVTPTQHLKRQWARSADEFGLLLEPAWSSGAGALPADAHGVVVTYQQVASSARALRALSRGAFVVLDEVHHAGESRAWGDAIRLAFESAGRRLLLSGTPFRSDDVPIPFVRYEAGEATPDFEYGYGDALGEGRVVRPIHFPRVGGRMEWRSPDGTRRVHTFAEPLDAELSSQRLRTALSLEGEWLPAILVQAGAQLEALRRVDPRAAGLVIATDQEHARGIARILRERCGVLPAVATSDDPAASDVIARFARGSAPWIVAVRMVSEGVDIPRLRVGVYASLTTTDLFFRQAAGRLVRWTPGLRAQRAYMFLPDDPRLRAHAEAIARERRHRLREADEGTDPRDADVREPLADAAAEEAESLFAAISAVPLGVDGRPFDPARPIEEPPPGALEEVPAPPAEPAPRLARLPLPEPPPGATTAPSRRERKERLRAENAEKVRALVHAGAGAHAEVNAELNRRAGIRKIVEATEGELRRRLAAAEGWLKKLGRS